ncbi:MAG: hypothetical protein KF744_16675 [Taibaiella sp.]|nr:hypothetical protein [Taibaiella sp.]
MTKDVANSNSEEELEDIRLYDEAKAAGEPSIPIDEAFRIMDTERKKSGR